MPERVETRDLRVPCLREPRALIAVGAIHPTTDPRKRLERDARVRRHRDPTLLVDVHLGDVHVHEADVWVLKCRLRRGGEVTPTRADADHEIGVPGYPVRGRRSARPYPTERGGMVVRKRSFAGLRLGDGHARLIDKTT